MGIEIFNKLSMPPQSALKQITGGRLKGFTDINPQWRYKAMTDQFGLCGIGWRYEITKQWSEESGTGESMAFVNVLLYVKVNEIWSEAIPGTGGSMLVAKESKGPYASDEAYKMATTDALGVAMKMIGVASAIYEGRWDGSKYNVEAGGNDSEDKERYAQAIKNAKSQDELKAAFAAAWAYAAKTPGLQEIFKGIYESRKAEL